jgi:hypothetical protein
VGLRTVFGLPLVRCLDCQVSSVSNCRLQNIDFNQGATLIDALTCLPAAVCDTGGLHWRAYCRFWRPSDAALEWLSCDRLQPLQS